MKQPVRAMKFTRSFAWMCFFAASITALSMTDAWDTTPVAARVFSSLSLVAVAVLSFKFFSFSSEPEYQKPAQPSQRPRKQYQNEKNNVA